MENYLQSPPLVARSPLPSIRRPFELRQSSLYPIFSIPLFLLFLIPLVGLISQSSIHEIAKSLSDFRVLQAISISLKTTMISLMIIIMAGIPLSLSLLRTTGFFRNFIEVVIDLPTVLPPSVAGLALLLTLGRRSELGAWMELWGIQLSFTTAAVVIAQIFIAGPFFVRAASIGFGSIDQELIQAAELDGASRWQVFRYIKVPMAGSALISGTIMSWSRALGEFGATAIFAGNFAGKTQTMPLAIYLGFENDLSIALTLSVILIMFSFVTLFLLRLILFSDRYVCAGVTSS